MIRFLSELSSRKHIYKIAEPDSIQLFFMKKTLLYLSLFIATNSHGQSNCDCFDRLYNLANVDTNHRYAEIMNDAISFLPKEQRGAFYRKIGSHYNSSKNYDSAAIYYTKAVECGYDLDVIVRTEPQSYMRMDTSRMKKLAETYRQRIDIELYNAYIGQITLDQAVRNNSLLPDSNEDTTYCRQRLLTSIEQNIDKGTFHFLKWVFDNYQYPTFEQVGFDMNLWAMVLHVTAYENHDADYVLKKLTELNKSGSFPERSQILFLKDRQEYQNHRTSEAGAFCQYYNSIRYGNKADSIRYEYNLVSLKDEANKYRKALPAGYSPQPYPQNYFCLKKYSGK